MGIWKNYYLEKLKGQEDECGLSLSRTKPRLERENEACLVKITHKQSAVMDYVGAEIKQTSSEGTEVIAHLAKDTIGSIPSTVTCNVRVELRSIGRENLPANRGGAVKRSSKHLKRSIRRLSRNRRIHSDTRSCFCT